MIGKCCSFACCRGRGIIRGVDFLVEPTTMVSASHSTLELHAELGSLIFRIIFAEHCVFTLLSFVISASISGPLIGGLAEYYHVFENDTALTESGILLPLLAREHVFVSRYPALFRAVVVN